MPSYRVEVSPNNRAGCQDAVCKKNGDKITKGEIRFGAWVEGTSGVGHEFQGWKWRHWGCVSGKTMQNIRESLTGSLADEDDFQWDNMDGLEDMPQDFQEKIKRAIIEGKIADEDWKGDPAFNVLGKTGIRGRATPKKKEPEESEESVENVVAAGALANPVGKKRGRARDEDEDEEAKPIKKRVIKAKKEEDGGDDAKPAKKTRTRKSAKKEEESSDEEWMKKEQDPEMDADMKPARNRRARKSSKKEEESSDEKWMKREQDPDMETSMKPAMKSKAKKGVKKEVDTEVTGLKTEDDNEAAVKLKLARKVRGNKDIKEETDYESQVKTKDNGRVNVDTKPAKNIRGKKAAKEEESKDGSLMKKEEDERSPVDTNLKLKHEEHENFDGVKKEEGSDISFSARENHAAESDNAEGAYKAEMPQDPLKQIALAFCDREGPLVGEFSRMVEAQEVAGDDWDGFLQKKFRKMTDAGEIENEDFDGFLRMMHEREVAFREPVPVAPKKGRKRKNAPVTVAKPRTRRSKAS